MEAYGWQRIVREVGAKLVRHWPALPPWTGPELTDTRTTAFRAVRLTAGYRKKLYSGKSRTLPRPTCAATDATLSVLAAAEGGSAET